MKRIFLSILVVGLLLLGACAPTSVSESAIPAHFTTYTDEAGLFSISYPPDWELALSTLEEMENIAKDYGSSLDPDIPLELSLLFIAGVPTGLGYYDPSVNIWIQPLPAGINTLDEWVESEIRGLKKYDTEYREFSRVKTIIGGKEAIILDSEGYTPRTGKFRCLQVFILTGKVKWIVTCGTVDLEQFDDFEDDLYAIVRSLRVLK